MGLRPIILKDAHSSTEVIATLNDDLSIGDLFDAERAWCLHRVDILRKLVDVGIARRDLPQSAHWSWAYKAAVQCDFDSLNSGQSRLIGVYASAAWQCLLMGTRVDNDQSSKPLVYVDFIESAPWNWPISSIGQIGRFRGAGLHLMETAVAWSIELGYNGRLGLHALPQADGFYSRRCYMQNFGPDLDYQGLCYFELDEYGARKFMESR